MYPHELKNFIDSRNSYIGGDDLLKVISIKENPQLNHIKLNPETNVFEMWDYEGNYYNFTAIPYKEALEKGLVKQKDEQER